MNSADTKKYDEFASKTLIDPLRLDDALIEMPSLMMEAVEATAFAVNTRDTLKAQLEQTKALVGERIRLKHTTDKKPSEAFIEATVPLDDAYKLAQAAYLAACLDTDLWKGVVEALRTKSASIDRVCTLMQAGYMTRSSVFSVDQTKRRGMIVVPDSLEKTTSPPK